MGSGCASSCNSARNRLPKNIEGYRNRTYWELSDKKRNRSKISPDNLKCSLNKYSNRNSAFWDLANKSSDGSHYNSNSTDFTQSPIKNFAVVGESMNHRNQTHFSNIIKEDYGHRTLSERSVRSCESTTSGELPNEIIDNVSVHCRDSETKRALDRTRESDKEVNAPFHNGKDVQVEKNYSPLDTSIDLAVKMGVNVKEGSLAERKTSAEKQKWRRISTARRCLDDSELMVQKQEASKCNKMEESFRRQMMAWNNPSDKSYDMALVSNPGICIYPSFVKKQRKVQTSGCSVNVALQPRARIFKSGISNPKESSGRVTSAQLHNTKGKWTNRQPRPKNCEIQQFQANNINLKKIDGCDKDFCDRNSLSLMSETAIFCEMDRCLAVTSTDPDTNCDESLSGDVEWGWGGNERPFVREQKPYLARESHEAESVNSEFMFSDRCNDSFLNLEKQLFSGCEQAVWASSFSHDEMVWKLENTRAHDVEKLSQSKIGTLGASEICQKSQTGAGINESLDKMNKPDLHLVVDSNLDRFEGALQPLDIFSDGISQENYSVLSTGKAMFHWKNDLRKNILMDVEEKKRHQPNNTGPWPVTLTEQADQTIVPEQSPPFTPERNKDVQYSFMTPSKCLTPISPKSCDTVTLPQKKRTSQQQSINFFDSPSSAQDIEHGIKDIFSNPKLWTEEVSKWTVQDVEQWIMELDDEVSHYSEVFKSFSIDGELLLVLTSLDFASLIPNEMDRQILLKALEKIRQSTEEISWNSTEGLLHRYQLKKLIKIGMFSTTHLAHDLENGNRICAVKLISSEKSRNLRHPELAAKEVALKEWLAISPSMQHQNMIEYYEHCTDKIYLGTHYKYIVVREHHELNLELLISNGIALGENVPRLILHQIVSLLCFLRLQQIGHFDLQPSNILVTNDKWQIKLTDWGSFKQFTRKSIHSKSYLDIDHLSIYTAPEIYSHNEYALIAESWSVGVILFGLITGIVLFSSMDERDTVYKTLREDSFEDFSRSLDDKISWSLTNVTKSFIFNLVRYNAGDRLDIENFENSKYYRGVLPSIEEYKSAMEIAFYEFLRHSE